jgi:DNA-binding Lrp family transcriptional regulator
MTSKRESRENKESPKLTQTDIEEVDLYAELDDLDRKIIKIKTAEPKLNISEIAKRLDLHRTTVSNHLEKEKVKRYLDIISKSALDVLLDAQKDAAMRLIRLTMSSDEKIILGACKEILTGVLAKTYQFKDESSPLRRFVDSLTEKDYEEWENGKD